jgi:nucleotidyltransferase/DNA polymerase involved in DNA repair
MACADHKRTILHIDLDAFYVQVALLAHPHLRGRPVGIQQKHTVVTCSYEARAWGVTKLQLITEARRRCPELVLVHGEDLAPFRAASTAILAVLRAHLPPGTPIERLVLEEFFVDATRVVDAAAAADRGPLRWCGHVHRPAAAAAAGGGDPDCADGPTDDAAAADGDDDGSVPTVWCTEQPAKAAAAAAETAAAASGSTTSSSAGSSSFPVRDACGCGCVARLAAGSALAWTLRRAVHAQLGLTTSGGIGVSKLAAKAASGLHKPDDQTALLPWHTALLLAHRRPVDALPGVGGATAAGLVAGGLPCGTVRDLAALPPQAVAAAMRWPLAQAAALVDLAAGRDATPVTPTGPPASLSDEDTYAPPVTQWDAARAELGKLVRGVLARVAEDAAEHGGRLPGTVKVTVRHVPPPSLPAPPSAAAAAAAAASLPQQPAGGSGGGGGGAYYARVTRQGPVPVTAFAVVRKRVSSSSSVTRATATAADGSSSSSSAASGSAPASISELFQRQLQQSAASLVVVEPPSASTAASSTAAAARSAPAPAPPSSQSGSSAAQPADDAALSDEPLEAACWALFKRVVAETAPSPPQPPTLHPLPPFCVNLIGVTVSNFSASASTGAAASSIAAFARSGVAGAAAGAGAPASPTGTKSPPVRAPPAASSSSSSLLAAAAPVCPPGVDAAVFAALPRALQAELAAAGAAAAGAASQPQPSKPRPPQQTRLSFGGQQQQQPPAGKRQKR